jgi:4-amino-4-deoxy-L-arabinose transferase-like glycosyltransferase
MNRLHLQASVLFGLGLIASLLFGLVIYPFLEGNTSGIDPDGYGEAGRLWYTSRRFEAIDKAPLYPAFLALVAWISAGYDLRSVQIAQSLLWAGTVVILFLLFRRTIPDDRRLPFAAGLLCAIYPLALWYTPRLWTETFLTFGIALYTLALVALLKKPAVIKALLCGLAVGFVALSKGIGLVFLPLTILVLLAFFRRAAWRWIILSSLAALLCLLPWTWRNWQLTSAVIPIHTDSGYNLYLGNGFARHWSEAPFSYTELKALALRDLHQANPGLDEAANNPVWRDQQLLRIAVQELVDAPALLLKKLVIQSLTFWYLAADFQKSLLTGLLQIPLLLAALIGVRRGWADRSWALCLLIPISGIMVVSVLVFAFARLSATVLPYVIGLAVYGLWPRPKLRPVL